MSPPTSCSARTRSPLRGNTPGRGLRSTSPNPTNTPPSRSPRMAACSDTRASGVCATTASDPHASPSPHLRRATGSFTANPSPPTAARSRPGSSRWTLRTRRSTRGLGCRRLLWCRHYDHTGKFVAMVRAVDGRVGPWLSGQVAPWCDPMDAVKLGHCFVSGDWRGGGGAPKDLRAVLAVNVEGFSEKSRAVAASGADTEALVAAGIPVDALRRAPPTATGSVGRSGAGLVPVVVAEILEERERDQRLRGVDQSMKQVRVAERGTAARHVDCVAFPSIPRGDTPTGPATIRWSPVSRYSRLHGMQQLRRRWATNHPPGSLPEPADRPVRHRGGSESRRGSEIRRRVSASATLNTCTALE